MKQSFYNALDYVDGMSDPAFVLCLVILYLVIERMRLTRYVYVVKQNNRMIHEITMVLMEKELISRKNVIVEKGEY